MGGCGVNENINRTIIVKPRRTLVRSVESNYEVLPSDVVVGVDSSVGSFTITLPRADVIGEKIMWIKDIGANSFNNNIIIETKLGDTIIDVASGQTSTIIGVNGGALALSSDGFNEYWVI